MRATVAVITVFNGEISTLQGQVQARRWSCATEMNRRGTTSREILCLGRGVRSASVTLGRLELRKNISKYRFCLRASGYRGIQEAVAPCAIREDVVP